MIRQAVLMVALLVSAGLAHAECSCEGVANCLGVYFDEGQWMQTCLETVPVNQPFHTYFVLQNSVFDAIGGFEFAWRFEPEITFFVLNAQVPPGVVSEFSPTNVICGLSIPFPTTGPAVLMDLTFFMQAAPFTTLGLGPSTPDSIDGHAAMYDFSEPPAVVPINFPCPVGDDGWTTEPVAWFGNCASPVEARTWGSIKVLYR